MIDANVSILSVSALNEVYFYDLNTLSRCYIFTASALSLRLLYSAIITCEKALIDLKMVVGVALMRY